MIKIEPKTFKGSDYVDIRKYFKDSNGNDCPTKKGICIKRNELPELLDAIGAHLTENELSSCVNTLSRHEERLFKLKAGEKK